MRFFTFLSLLIYANLSLALGFGDIQLKSHLGEKFFATVNVTDLDSVSEPSCFTATDTSDVPAFKKAKILLKPVNGNHQLTITTYDVITEPIINLNVSFHCETNLNREYVLLLDPAPLLSVEKPEIAEAASGATLTNSVANKPKGQANLSGSAQYQAQEDNQITPEKAVAQKRTKNKITSIATNIDEKLSESYTGKQNTKGSNPSSISDDNKAIKTLADKPFLIISGGATNSNDNGNKPNLSLRLATEIDFSRPEAAIAPQTTTDAMDEVTVMANRLAHLEKQITTLQSRNAQLVLDAEKVKAENAKTDWLLILKIALGIILALVTAELLRRKLSNKQENNSDSWFDTKRFDAEEPASASNDAKLFSSTSKNSLEFSATEAVPLSENGNSMTSIHSPSFSNKASVAPEKEDHGSIMDDADVFIEHGRPALAIQLLQNHLIDSPAESPVIWLKLINLLSKEGSETEYDDAVLECNKHFNIKAAEFGGATEPDDSSIEDYPHIITRLEGVWGSPYAVGFINDLINNKRSQPREGLNQGAFEDLFFLKQIAKYLEYSNPPSQKVGSDQPLIPNPASDNVAFNDALFTDTEHTDDIKISLATSSDRNMPLIEKADLNIDDFNLKASPFEKESSYEVHMIPNDDEFPSIGATQEFDDEQSNRSSQIDTSFRVQEIDFTHPLKKVALLNEELVLEKNRKIADNNDVDLTFSLDFQNESAPVEASSKESLLKDKSRNKAKTKPSANPSPESNEIEWDLPEISPKKQK
ncbi:MAG: hypothetical protein Q8K83_06100 [Methylotenera sp.]|nr:hypothetical protein [Methylotenera sp.]